MGHRCVSQIYNRRDLLLSRPVSVGNSVINALKIKHIGDIFVSSRVSDRQ